MKTTIAKAVNAYKLLATAKLNKMEAAEQIALVKAMRPLRDTAEDYDNFIKESVKKLAPEGWEQMQEHLRGLESLKEAELAERIKQPEVEAALKARAEYNDKIVTLDRDESAKEVDMAFKPLADDALGRLFSGNDFTAAQCMALADLLGRPDTETENPQAE